MYQDQLKSLGIWDHFMTYKKQEAVQEQIKLKMMREFLNVQA